MCILAYVTHSSQRFPLVLINNRDEMLNRVTHPVSINTSTGILCAVDGVAGGSWLGVNIHNGRFAILTNSTRSPTAPLQESLENKSIKNINYPSTWRGAMPLTEVIKRMKLHTLPASDGGTDVRLEFIPDLSRGCIVRDYLIEGGIPGESHPIIEDDKLLNISPSLASPYFDGYNLLTSDNLFNPEQLQLFYTTNRYGAEYKFPTDHGIIHCLQNSYIDNWMEPKTALLRDLFQTALKDVIPTDSKPYNAESVATKLASSCLCVENKFDLLREIKDGTAPAKKLQEYEQVLDASFPFHGYNGEAELVELYGAGLRPPVHFPTEGYKERANFRQSSIFMQGHGYVTRTQTVVVVEKKPNNEGVFVHYSQRNCGIDGAPHKPWSHFAIPAKS